MDTGEGMGALSFSVGVSIPKPILEAAKLLPGLKKELPFYAQAVQASGDKALATADAAIIAGESIAVAAVFGVIVYALLSRERK